MQKISSPDRQPRTTRRSTLISSAVAALAVLLAALAPSPAQSIIIDDFTTNQATQTLTYPPSGTTSSSSVLGTMLGGERDLQVNLNGGIIAGNSLTATVSSGFFSYSQGPTITGTGVLQWDGVDGTSTLNPTGLGGIDLRAAGSQDAFLLNVTFDDLPANVVMVVYTDAGNASSMTFTLPGLIFSSTNFVFPYSSFTPLLGAGADFSNVGAITLTVGAPQTAPDLVFDFLQTTSTLTAVKSVTIANDVNGNGQANPGDTLRYSIAVCNPADSFNASATGVVFSNNTAANTTLVNGSVTTTQGTVTMGNTGGDTNVAVNIGTIVDGACVTVTYDVIINNPLPPGVTQIICQGLVTSDTLTNLLTNTVVIQVSPPAIIELPTLSDWGLLALLLALAGIGIRRLRGGAIDSAGP